MEGLARHELTCEGSPFEEGLRPKGRMTVDPVWVGGTELDPTHVLTRFRGIVVCHRCGCIATERPRDLAKPCNGYRTTAGQRNLDYLHKEPPQLPMNMKSWPE